MSEGMRNLPGQSRGGRHETKYAEFAEKCREQPWFWFEFPREFSGKNQRSNVTTGIKRGEYSAFRPPEEWHAAQRGGKVYVRFVGAELK